MHWWRNRRSVAEWEAREVETISLLYAYSDVMTELLKIAAPVTARAIASEERMALEDVR